MSTVTRILHAIEAGEPQAVEQLLPLVYDELRKLAAARLAHEQPGQTLQATALVHEAYLRLVGPAGEQKSEIGDQRSEGSSPTSDLRLSASPARQAAEVLGVSTRPADRRWVYGRAWLFRKIGRELASCPYYSRPGFP
jgi:hypothetical protein